MEKELDIKPIGIKMFCDKCKKGEMLPNGNMLLSDPPQWEHKCNKCGHEENYKYKYPRIRWDKA